jgi:hypothetical protein
MIATILGYITYRVILISFHCGDWRTVCAIAPEEQ